MHSYICIETRETIYCNVYIYEKQLHKLIIPTSVINNNQQYEAGLTITVLLLRFRGTLQRYVTDIHITV